MPATVYRDAEGAAIAKWEGPAAVHEIQFPPEATEEQIAQTVARWDAFCQAEVGNAR